jgi:hypothetical protein
MGMMAEIRHLNGRVTLEMSFQEYRDLTEVVTMNANHAHRHGKCTDNEMMRQFREKDARGGWEWANKIGIPPLVEGETQTFTIEGIDG